MTQCVLSDTSYKKTNLGRIFVMAATPKPRLSLRQMRASMKRMQTEGERLVTRLRRDARALTVGSRREAVSGLMADARRFQTDLRKRAERAIEEIDSQRARILSVLEEQATRLVEAVVKRLNLVTRDDLQELTKRLASVERRLDTLAKEKREAAA
jgi:polyhydroxyalkanoate synthesis regulator phasin